MIRFPPSSSFSATGSYHCVLETPLPLPHPHPRSPFLNLLKIPCGESTQVSFLLSSRFWTKVESRAPTSCVKTLYPHRVLATSLGCSGETESQLWQTTAFTIKTVFSGKVSCCGSWLAELCKDHRSHRLVSLSCFTFRHCDEFFLWSEILKCNISHLTITIARFRYFSRSNLSKWTGYQA